jgi:hypothetical protein
MRKKKFIMNSKSFLKKKKRKKKVKTSLKRKRATILNENREWEKVFFYYQE